MQNYISYDRITNVDEVGFVRLSNSWQKYLLGKVPTNIGSDYLQQTDSVLAKVFE